MLFAFNTVMAATEKEPDDTIIETPKNDGITLDRNYEALQQTAAELGSLLLQDGTGHNKINQTIIVNNVQATIEMVQ